MEEQKCVCGKHFLVDETNSWWDDTTDSSVSYKLARCPYCGQLKILKWESYCNQDINNDDRLFIKRKI